ncbi:MAG: 5-dehydro-4-deoxy-D-glucuronate isomerase [Firmicutes bacterium]|nr:5-dehydro-4-deoxy-D-glucuronate isomerase [Bacillota bacterium]
MKFVTRYPSHPEDAKHYTTERLRESYLIETVFAPDKALFAYSHFDRIIAGGVMPVSEEVTLTGGKEMASASFLERREMGVINVGGEGTITVDGAAYGMRARDGLYVGMGAETVSMASADPRNPAKFYINTCPAHASCPTVKIDIRKANRRPLGTAENCNKRTIYQYVHPDVLRSCQLCMGLTVLEPGSNWNTMPAHTHERRMEVYFYFDLPGDNIVFHMMGEPSQTRHIVMRNEQAVISPSWSIHSGVGTSRYAFIWGMCGENQTFDDMDGVAMPDIR